MQKGRIAKFTKYSIALIITLFMARQGIRGEIKVSDRIEASVQIVEVSDSLLLTGLLTVAGLLGLPIEAIASSSINSLRNVQKDKE